MPVLTISGSSEALTNGAHRVAVGHSMQRDLNAHDEARSLRVHEGASLRDGVDEFALA